MYFLSKMVYLDDNARDFQFGLLVSLYLITFELSQVWW